MKIYANYYHDGKLKFDNEWYYYKDLNNYLFSMGIYKTKIKEADLPDYYIKVWQYPRYKYISFKAIKDIYYRPGFFTNHWRKDDFLFISYNDIIKCNDRGFAINYDELIYGLEIDAFMKALNEYGYDNVKLEEIDPLMKKKDKWFQYWEKHNWKGNYSFTSEDIWKEILGDKN